MENKDCRTIHNSFFAQVFPDDTTTDKQAHNQSNSTAPLEKIGPRNFWGMLCTPSVQLSALCALHEPQLQSNHTQYL